MSPVSGEKLLLATNEDLMLDGPGAWVVSGGDLSVFAIFRTLDGTPGPRRHLFDVPQSEAVFGVPDLGFPSPYTLVATALQPSTLVYASDADLATEDGRLLLPGWVAALGRTIAAHIPTLPDAIVAEVGEVALADGQRFGPADEEPLWVRVEAGEVRLQGNRELAWLPADGPLLLGPHLVVQAHGPARLLASPPDAPMAAAGRAGLHALFARALPSWSMAEDADQIVRIAARARRDEVAAEAAMASLAGALHAGPAAPRGEGTPVLGACRLVGDFLGVAIQAPLPAELARMPDPVYAIARASRLRRRRVALGAGWWTTDAGALVGATAEGAPVALLPTGRGYVAADPETGARVPVDAAVAAGLAPFATMLYRPFGPGGLSAKAVARFALRGRRKDVAMLVAAGLSVTALGMLTPRATGLLIDQAIPDADRLLLGQMAVVLAATALGAAAFQALQGLATHRLEGHADADTQAAIWDRVLDLPAPFFRGYTVGDLESRVQAVGQIRKILSGLALKTAFSGLFAMGNLVLMVVASPLLSAIAVAVAAVIAAVTAGAAWLKLRSARPLKQAEGALRGLVVEFVQGVSKLRVAGAEARAFAHWARLFQEREASHRAIETIDAATQTFNAVAPLLASLAVFWGAATVAGLQIQGQVGGLSTGSFLMFYMAFGIFMRGATDLSTSLVLLLDIEPTWARARPILEARPESAGIGDHPGTLAGRVALERVTFRYAAGGRTILNDVSIAVEPGEHVAIVGPSGGGKSTIVRLLLGFEEPESGRVTYDGRDLARLDRKAVRRQLGVVLQGGRLLAGSIFENIACGAPLTPDEAMEAARHAGLEADLAALPMGLHTMVSEGGSNLSGGQRQRLLIARALASRPRIVVFDEATSALDNVTQAIVTASLTKLGVTRIVVAHRLSTIRRADRIFVVDGGKVVQAGTFDELAGHEGFFARSIARQLV